MGVLDFGVDHCSQLWDARYVEGRFTRMDHLGRANAERVRIRGRTDELAGGFDDQCDQGGQRGTVSAPR